ncbi:MAG: hypothetical protein KAV45_03355 [Calditrichia bacterium]|jgi:hypothetical protein|nr:hypothetical protein [Calditrichia bacterium]
MRTKIIIDQAFQALKDYIKIEMDWKILKNNKGTTDHVVMLKINTNKVKAAVMEKGEIRNFHIPQLKNMEEQNQNFILIANNISKPLRQKLREAKINFIDSAGNASINIGDIHIYVEGVKGDTTLKRARIYRASNLKLIWMILQKPDYLNRPYRELAKIAQVSLDTISKTLNALKNQGFIVMIDKKKNKLVHKNDLFNKWLNGFEDTLKPKLKRGTYRYAGKDFNQQWPNTKFLSNKILWGGEPAAAKLTQYLIPEIFTIYTNLTDIEILKQYRMVKDAEGNIEVNQLFFNPEIFRHNDLVPPLLIYADLQITGEDRNIETAKLIYEKYIANILQ